jgi:dGTPase
VIRGREQLNELEERTLASYASRSSQSLGRKHEEPPPRLRTAHQRDRDRVLHSEAFRRLQHKTQVFVVSEGDYYRTRLTHTIEVSQIARSLAAFLGANVTLANCIALMHDLGHPPYGHQGEVELDALAREHGLLGFDHNEHCLRLVDLLESRYPFPGLNLTWEAREGIGKHQTAFDHPNTPDEFKDTPQPGIEAQIANLADTLAYVTHDIEDALYYGFFGIAELEALGPMIARAVAEAGLQDAPARRYVRHGALTRVVLGRLIQDGLDETNRRLLLLGESPTPADVRACAEPVVALSEPVQDEVEDLIGFLMRRVYRHPSVEIMCDKGRRLLRQLFEHFIENPGHLPRQMQKRLDAQGSREDPVAMAQAVLDFMAGITDRHVVLLHEQIFSPHSRLLPHID